MGGSSSRKLGSVGEADVLPVRFIALKTLLTSPISAV